MTGHMGHLYDACMLVLPRAPGGSKKYNPNSELWDDPESRTPNSGLYPIKWNPKWIYCLESPMGLGVGQHCSPETSHCHASSLPHVVHTSEGVCCASLLQRGPTVETAGPG